MRPRFHLKLIFWFDMENMLIITFLDLAFALKF